MTKPVHVLDASVLYPVVVRDLLLTGAVADLYEPKWSAEILDEMRRNIVANNAHVTEDAINLRLIPAMKNQFPDAEVFGFEERIASMDNHPKDRHVAATAVHAQANRIVTYNVRDFRGEALPAAGVEIITPATLTQSWLDETPEVLSEVIEKMAARKQRPPMTPLDILETLERQQGFGPLEEGLRRLV